METEDGEPANSSDRSPAAMIVSPPLCPTHPCPVDEGVQAVDWLSSVHGTEGTPGLFCIQRSSDGCH